jgi:hypothetical protein
MIAKDFHQPPTFYSLELMNDASAILNKEMRRLTISEWRLRMRFHGECCPVLITIYP